ncbi:hypothetical protein [Aestuariicoccus sp. MJ-SS9]|uniref:hypothetical protein n=1 Tax=Aestuariicoccus sp. MJ-SS9 TaxID=3079855 RepID=UPI002909FF13|nr:hypothetical protein [Aestuariicoccus sp. MJ-SS9]MDU8913273.1 hypothetical protein [Aestuariicoccus sp. MJ-SS9]
MASSRRNKGVAVAFALAILLGGCGDYLNNRDRVALRAGNAHESNTAIQSIQAWPPESYNTDIEKGG